MKLRSIKPGLLFAALALLGCKSETGDAGSAQPGQPTWVANVESVETLEGAVSVRAPGSDEFAPWRSGEPIPGGSTVKTDAKTRAVISIPHEGSLVLNHSTEVELAAADRLNLKAGQAVLDYEAGSHKDPISVTLPTGTALLHGTKVALVAGDKASTVSVSQGLVEVQHDNESFEARPGQEILLQREAAPRVLTAADLDLAIGWSEIESDPDAPVIEVPRGLGKLVGKTPGGEQEHKLNLHTHRVVAKIQGNMSYTEVTEVFQNPTGQTLEGVYRFPLPADAQISRLALKVGNRIMEGEFLETARAEAIWRDIIEQWRDPAMLKWKQGNQFELRIFPIEPHQKREVTIGYVQQLRPAAEGYRYTYPMPVDHSGLVPAGEFDFTAKIWGHDPTRTLEVTGYGANIEHGATDADQAVTTVSYRQKDFVAAGDLGIRFARRGARKFETFAYREDSGDSFGQLVIRPELPGQTEVQPRDFVVILDTSYGRRGGAMDVQRALAPKLIDEMDDLDRVVVIACGTSCVPVADSQFQDANRATAQTVAKELAGIDARGATYPIEALRVAASLFARRSQKDRDARVIMFTDGLASAGELRPGAMADAIEKTFAGYNPRLTVVDVGGETDPTNLAAIARAGGGRVIELDPAFSATGQALRILSDQYRTLLFDPELQVPAGFEVATVLPTAIGSGEELTILGRVTGTVSGKARLVGRVGAEPFAAEYDVELKPTKKAGNAFLPRSWAQHRIRALELETTNQKDEIVRLSTRYGVLSRYTTLLALEDKEMMDEYGVRKQKRTSWEGDEGAESDGEAADEAEAPATAAPRPSKAKPKPRSSRRASKPQTKSSSAPSESKKKMDLSDDLDMLLDSNSKGSMGLGGSSSGKRYRRYRRPQPYTTIRDPRPATSWESQNSERKRAALDRDPTNRSRRMSYIRALMRADDITTARAQTESWLATNPMDPEAVVQMAQIDAHQGNVSDALQHLLDAIDTAPRARWLQSRLHGAFLADGDEGLACAFRVALEATEKRPPKLPADILACEMTTDVPSWFGDAPRAPQVYPDNSKPRSGQLVVMLSGPAAKDVDIALVEPSGRLLWWGSQRQRLAVYGVRGTVERLVLPTMRNGTYTIRLIPSKAGVSGAVELEVKTPNGSKSVQTTFSGNPQDVLELERGVR